MSLTQTPAELESPGTEQNRKVPKASEAHASAIRRLIQKAPPFRPDASPKELVAEETLSALQSRAAATA